MSSKRQKDILAMAAAVERVEVDALAERFGVTPQTIRRDLNELCDRGLLARVHGGARATNSVANIGYAERRAAGVGGPNLTAPLQMPISSINLSMVSITSRYTPAKH